MFGFGKKQETMSVDAACETIGKLLSTKEREAMFYTVSTSEPDAQKHVLSNWVERHVPRDGEISKEIYAVLKQIA